MVGNHHFHPLKNGSLGYQEQKIVLIHIWGLVYQQVYEVVSLRSWGATQLPILHLVVGLLRYGWGEKILSNAKKTHSFLFFLLFSFDWGVRRVFSHDIWMFPKIVVPPNHPL